MTYHVLAVYCGGVPEFPYQVFTSLPDAIAAWEAVPGDVWAGDGTDGEGRPFDPDRDRYVTDGDHYEARLQLAAAPSDHDRLAIAVRRVLAGRMAARGDDPSGLAVEVSEWVGVDEPWADPVYVTAEHPTVEFYDAVADLAAAPFVDQVIYVAGCLEAG
jgi:hypothetical protein